MRTASVTAAPIISAPPLVARAVSRQPPPQFDKGSLGALRDDSVSRDSNAVHFAGHPISHSQKLGVGLQPNRWRHLSISSLW
jgi:hypothetical protein